ncbi:helix-turn-helix transcriptional regulator [Nocardia thailandica]|uniref:helix-turn-helix transcriptional regulator n=1 Tax=Nocardia thailandica TaxID=257275 RepID=UPI0002D56B2F|nr:YafY family protein [Nocardia thailandica]
MDQDPTARTLTLLGLLQTGGAWPAATLAARLGVGVRTVRRDVDRLRGLGYPIRVRPGPGSGYRLGPGTSIPPLRFTADEVVALIAGLRMAAPRLRGDDSAATALAKLEQILPGSLRRRAAAVDLAVAVLDQDHAVPAATVGLVADAVAESGRLRFDYRDRHGQATTRTVDPYRHVLGDGRWYLVGFDVDRDDWRTFRFDRITAVRRVPGTYHPRPFPADSLGRWFATDFGRADVPAGSPRAAAEHRAPSPPSA